MALDIIRKITADRSTQIGMRASGPPGV